MNTQDLKHQALSEHLPYEAMMLSFHKMKTIADAYDWNAYHESFAVHARDLKSFLTNDPDRKNFHAVDFTSYYKPDKPGDLASVFQDLDRQVLHMGRLRTTESERKVSTDDAHRIFDWINPALQDFVNALPDSYRSIWNHELASRHKDQADQLKRVGSLLTACTAVQMTGGPTLPGPSTYAIVDKPV
jgi:hypothetical protein